MERPTSFRDDPGRRWYHWPSFLAEARKEGVEESNRPQKRAIHVEFTTDDLDGLYEELKSRGVAFHQPPHDEPWERSMTALDPDGYSVEFAQGKRGHNQTKS